MTRSAPEGPSIVVLSSLFPSSAQPGAGLFVRERMFRVGRELPLCVVSPVPWFPFQGLIRRFRPGFRPGAPHYERQDGFEVWFPRFLSVPGLFKRLDGLLMALGCWRQLRQLKSQGRLDVLDAHFGYPDGYAAMLLGRWLRVPVSITLRGTESRHAQDRGLAPLLRRALCGVDQIFSVSESLARVAIALDARRERVRVVGNGVDIARFKPVDRQQARARLGLPADARVMVTVGGLVERKGFHRVMKCVPELQQRLGPVYYLIVGGPSPEGDWTEQLHRLRSELGLEDCIRFLGPLPPGELSAVLSAADIFALATRNEGWANVLLEAMACGLPVVATDVGGNAEVVNSPELGHIVPFDDHPALLNALQEALSTPWDRAAIQAYAQANTWDRRVGVLVSTFKGLARA